MSNPLNHVLVVDDDEINNLLCKKIISLSEVSALTSFTTSVADGMDLLNNYTDAEATLNVPELILLDINMPIEDGFDFLNQYMAAGFYEKLHNTKIIMLTTSVYSKDKDKAYTYPCVVDYITKPLKIDLLKELVSQHFMLDSQISM